MTIEELKAQDAKLIQLANREIAKVRRAIADEERFATAERLLKQWAAKA